MVGEQWLPPPRREFLDAVGRVLGDALQDVDKVCVDVNAVQTASNDQALRAANVTGAEFGPAEHPILAPQRHDPQRTFELISGTTSGTSRDTESASLGSRS